MPIVVCATPVYALPKSLAVVSAGLFAVVVASRSMKPSGSVTAVGVVPCVTAKVDASGFVHTIVVPLVTRHCATLFAPAVFGGSVGVERVLWLRRKSRLLSVTVF